MDNSILNENENLGFKKEKETEFLKSVMIVVPQQLYENLELKIGFAFRHLCNPENVIYVEKVE